MATLMSAVAARKITLKNKDPYIKRVLSSIDTMILKAASNGEACVGDILKKEKGLDYHATEYILNSLRERGYDVSENETEDGQILSYDITW
jgi:hypothetical protein